MIDYVALTHVNSMSISPLQLMHISAYSSYTDDHCWGASSASSVSASASASAAVELSLSLPTSGVDPETRKSKCHNEASPSATSASADANPRMETSPPSLCSRYGVEVRETGDERGKILVTTRPIAASSLVMIERPLVGMAHMSDSTSKGDKGSSSSAALRAAAASSCVHCMRPMADMRNTWEMARKEEERLKEEEKRKKMKRKAKFKSKKADADAGADAASVENASSPLPRELPYIAPISSSASSNSSASTPLPHSSASSASTSASPSASKSVVHEPRADTASSAGEKSDNSIKDNADTFTLRFPVCQPVPCRNGCEEVYCSATCRDAAWMHSHQLLCAASAANEPSSVDAGAAAAVTKWKKHALARNEIFLLAGQAVSHMLLAALRILHHDETVRQAFTSASSTPVQPADDLLEFALQLYGIIASLPPSSSQRVSLQSALASASSISTTPFLRFCAGSKPWWDHASLPPQLDPDDEVDWREALCGSVEQTMERWMDIVGSKIKMAAQQMRLDSAIPPCMDLLTALGMDHLCTLDLFSRLLSSFELNNIGFHAPTLFQFYHAHLDALPPDLHTKVQQQLGASAWKELEAYSMHSREGTGLFVIGCCMNHSCEPNVTIMKKDEVWSMMQEERMRGEKNEEFDALIKSLRELHVLPSEHDSSSIPSFLLDGSACFVALRDIAAGDELNISYIDLLQPSSQPSSSSSSRKDSDDGSVQLEEVSVERRQQLLRDYQFTCNCPKCKQQRNATATGKPLNDDDAT